MKLHRQIFKSKGPGLTRQDLIEFEHLLKDNISSFLPFKSYSLYFPQSLPKEMQASLDSGGGGAVYIGSESRLLLPLILHGRTLGVFVAKGVKLQAPKTLPPYLIRLASMCLEQILLYKQSVSDPLTGLYNRDYFLQALEAEIETIRNSILPDAGNAVEGAIDGGPAGFSGCCGLIVLDVDYFSWVNENYGHTFGDKVIAAIACILREACPPQVAICRLRDDTFGMIWPEASPLACDQLAERVRVELSSRIFDYEVTGERVSVTASLGYCNYPQDLAGPQLARNQMEQARILLRKATKALAAAKDQGRNRVFPFRRILAEGGSVLEVLPMNRLAVSLGRSVDAQEGMRFLVWSPKFQKAAQVKFSDEQRILGRYPTMYKAEIVLIEVQGEMAFAEVMHQNDPTWTLEPGDRLSQLPESEAFPEAPQADGATPQKDMLTGLYTYRDFISAWARARKGMKQFCLIGVRLADFREPAPGQESAHDQSVDARIQDVCRMVRDLIGPLDIGGRFSLSGLIYFLPDQDPAEVAGRWETLVRRASEELGLTVAVGIASYPCLSFGRGDILENCRKAIDHAQLLEPPMLAAFDTVSLTISADRHFTQGDTYAAVEEYKLALLLDEQNLLARNSLGVCHARLRQFDKARQQFETVIKRDGKNVMALYNLGCVCLKLGEADEARRALQKCLKLDPDHVFSLIRLGRLAEESGALPKARSYYERALACGDGLVRRDLARLCLLQDRVDEAREHLHQALLTDPKDAYSLHLLARLYLDSGEDPEIAEALARQSAALKPDHPDHWRELARALDVQGKTTEAAEARERAIAV